MRIWPDWRIGESSIHHRAGSMALISKRSPDGTRKFFRMALSGRRAEEFPGSVRTFRVARAGYWSARVSGRTLARNPGTRGDNHGESADGEGTSPRGRLLAGRQLPVGRPDLSLRQPPAQEAPDQGAREAAVTRPLGDHAGTQLHLRPPQPAH